MKNPRVVSNPCRSCRRTSSPDDFVPVVGPIHPTVGFVYEHMEDLDGVWGQPGKVMFTRVTEARR